MWRANRNSPLLAECATKLRKEARIAFRVNPDVAADTHPYISTGLHKHKFGVPIGSARELYARASETKYLKVAGVSVHIGSQITDVAPFAETTEPSCRSGSPITSGRPQARLCRCRRRARHFVSGAGHGFHSTACTVRARL